MTYLFAIVCVRLPVFEFHMFACIFVSLCVCVCLCFRALERKMNNKKKQEHCKEAEGLPFLSSIKIINKQGSLFWTRSTNVRSCRRERRDLPFLFLLFLIGS